MDCSEKQHRFQTELIEWGNENLREFPWRDSDNPYEILTAELFLKQTPADKVVPVYKSFIDRYPNLGELLEADENELRELIRPLGLYNQRVNALTQIAEEIHQKGVPADADRLMSLPYVGQYSANAILCFGYERRLPLVDVNVIRIYRRVFDLPEDWHHRTPEMWEFAEKLLPEQEYQLYNLSLLDFGAKICTSQSPSCADCFASAYCEYYQRCSTTD